MSQPTTARRLGLYLVKALLALLSLAALVSYPANAQVPSPGGQWVVQDSNGKTLTANPDGSYTLYGPVTETASEKYPGVLAAAHNNPQLDGAYVPSELSPNPDPIYNGGSTGFTSVFGAFAVASNADQMNGGYIPYLGSISAPVFLNGSITDNITGTLTQTWTWIPAAAPNGQPAPAVLNLLVSAPVSVDISPNYSNPSLSSGLTGTASASNGLGDTANMTEGSVYAKQSLPGKHLVQFPVGAGGSVTVTVSAQGSVSLTNSVTYGALFPTIPQPYPTDPYVYRATNGFAYSMGAADVSASAQQDHRAVTISADCDTPGTYYKVLSGGVDANGDGLCAKVAHQRDSDGTMKADIGIPYGEMHTAVVIGVAGGTVPVITTTHKTVTYTAHIPGNWATQDAQYLWNSSLKKYSLSGSLHHLFGLGLPTEAEIPVLTNTYVGAVVDSDHGGAITANEAGTTGTPDHIFFKFQNGDNRTVYPSPQFATGNDGDGATATANYWLTVHQPIEVFPSNRPSETNHYHIAAPPPAAGDIPMSFQGLDYCTYKGTGSNGVSAICVINSPSVGWSLSSDVTSALSSVPYPGWWGVLDVIFSGANIYIKHATPQSQNFPADFTDMAWNDPQSTGDPYYSANTYSKAYFHMSPRVRVEYRWNYKLVDVYDASGFKSETLVHDEEYIGPQNVFGDFTYVGPTIR